MTALASRETVVTPSVPARPTWHRPALAVLLLGTAVLYLWGLGASGWANAFYSAAAQAGSQSWKALFFGSSDAANAITVDKTPAALWVMGLSARLFGVNAWSVLVPQALMGVGSVWLLYATVRRTSGPAAGLVAGLVLALTPAAALMFRFNNPDALLVLLLVAAAYCVVRAGEKASPRWLALAGVAVGFGFLAKMLQAFLVLPAFALAYLIAAPVPLGKRLLHLLGAFVSTVAAAGWYLLVVALWPAADRPFIGGSQTNSLWELVFGYNGFGRITGDEVGSVGGGAGRGWGSTGLTRLFGSEMAGGIAWLLPAALLALGAGLWFTRRAPRTDRSRAALLLWGGWLVVTALVFSYMGGIIHPYYTVALAPPIAALVGTAAVQLWRLRSNPAASGLLSGGVALTALTAYLVLSGSTWQPWLAPTILVGGLLAAAALFFAAHLTRWAATAVAVLALVVTLSGTGAYTLATASVTHSGAIPSAGPSSGFGGRGPGGFAGGGRGGGPGSLLSTTMPGASLTALLQKDASQYTWTAATVLSNAAAGYQLASGAPVMAVGGFNGTDPYPTLAQFQQYVADGRIHYFLGEGMTMQGSSGSDAAQQIAEWVAENYKASTVDGVTVYDLISIG
ncbi:4-amino-4-deoxy-L-arabinose transferase-like glycosyltransferase [Amycolatopsis lexingtonensis]|uniref:4-amino-4-deoxy-L-arabinose transferase-like glycosyltransferase n=1 Tax=Amycolatopsis lexingtonensis TaxID=218822 RepID=A0ABR9IGG9_9PSEU|nr:glycosyltransferase family 39 protein [Amycolatopsis lexingtonensis]MBE1502277.1 4-amino-4-deoxy-L-arabinose transferase-like glycosyltransferase [Amycolatopsis lexingtonensis]